MIDRIPSGFHPFVLPFLAGMIFVLSYCVYGIIKILVQLPGEDRRRFYLSLVTPKTALKNIRDIFCDCLFHVKLWKRNRLLGLQRGQDVRSMLSGCMLCGKCSMVCPRGINTRHLILTLCRIYD